MHSITSIIYETSLWFSQIDYIPKNAFDFHKETNDALFFNLLANNLNDTSIEILAFTNSKRPLRIEFTNRFTYLDEKIFGPILRIDKRNT
jgi:hypothetical protein